VDAAVSTVTAVNNRATAWWLGSNGNGRCRNSMLVGEIAPKDQASRVDACTTVDSFDLVL
jgi:hypothetical protein